MLRNFLFLPFRFCLIGLSVWFSSIGCYKAPKSGGIFDFLPLQASTQALNTPGTIQVNVVGLASVTSVTTALVVGNNFGDPTLSFTADGQQNFSVSHKPGQPVSLSLTQPVTTPQVNCSTFSPPSFTTSPNTVFTIQCTLVKHSISVQVFGVYSGAPAGLVVGNLVGATTETLAINSGDGTYTFPTQIGETIAYSVSVQGNPVNHTCYMRTTTVPPPSSTMGTANITLFVNCLSVIASPPNVAAPAATIQYTISSPGVTGCGASSGPVPSGYSSLDSAVGSISYTNTANSTIVQVSPTSVWSAAAQTKGWLSLKNCMVGTNVLYESNKNADALLTVLQNIRYVDVNKLTGLLDCSTDMDACTTIQAGVTSCNATGQVCYVLIANGNYPLTNATSNIVLNAKTSLSGNYSPDFQSQGTGAGTNIVDTRTLCNVPGNVLYGATLCPAIEVKPTVAAGEIFEINNVTVIAHPGKPQVAGIFVYDYLGSGMIQIYQSGILGSTYTGVTSTTDERYGIIVTNSNNVAVFSNIIVGGTGGGVSIGAIFDYVHAYSAIFNNLIDSGSSSGLLPANYSAGIEVRNQNTSNFIAIANNQINYYQFINPAAPINRRSVGLRIAASNATLTWAYFIQNTIYAGNGTITAKAVEVLLNSAVIQLFNNILFGPDTSGPNTAMETLMPSGSSVIAGNNYYGTTLLNITATGAAGYCPTDFQFTMNMTCSPAGSPPSGFFNGSQYNKFVQYQSGPASYGNAFAFYPETVAVDPPCDVRSGGLGFGIDSNFTNIQNTDFFYHDRTTSPYGRSIGAIQINVPNCSP